ncbi:sugar phosphate isomerase/epimerase [soil metagenome]
MGVDKKRRKILKTLVAAPVMATSGILFTPTLIRPQSLNLSKKKQNLKISLNAYSFNEPLRNGSMSLDDLLEFCAEHGFDAVDLTAYYFPGYPQVPPDDFLHELKRKAFMLGLAISGTGVRNEFADPDERNRKKDITLVKQWIEAASKIGAPVIRIFGGHLDTEGYSWEQVAEWMVKDIQECVEFGKKHGVVVAVQNHNAFLKTAAQTIRLIEMVNSKWFGLILDIGSYRQGSPYQEIEKAVPHAVSWQIKEKVYINEEEEDVDLDKLLKIIKSSEYRGYLPIETLGPGDPKVKVPAFLEKVRMALEKTKN